MTLKDCHEIMQRLDVSWHRELGLEGNFFLGRFEAELMLSMISYKRICDSIEEELGRDELFDGAEIDKYEEAYRYGMISYVYKEIARWEYVRAQRNKIRALKAAVECINATNSDNPNRAGDDTDAADSAKSVSPADPANSINAASSASPKDLEDGDKLISEFSYSPVDEVSLNAVVGSWIEILSRTDLGQKKMDEDTWVKFTKLIRSKIG